MRSPVDAVLASRVMIERHMRHNVPGRIAE
jgi:hypothetical protein